MGQHSYHHKDSSSYYEGVGGDGGPHLRAPGSTAVRQNLRRLLAVGAVVYVLVLLGLSSPQYQQRLEDTTDQQNRAMDHDDSSMVVVVGGSVDGQHHKKRRLMSSVLGGFRNHLARLLQEASVQVTAGSEISSHGRRGSSCRVKTKVIGDHHHDDNNIEKKECDSEGIDVDSNKQTRTRKDGTMHKTSATSYGAVHFPTAQTSATILTVSVEDLEMLRTFSERVHANVTDLHRRVRHIPWGGTQDWWLSTLPTPAASRKGHHHPAPIDGARTLLAHYKYIRRHSSRVPFNWTEGVHFPLKLCRHGCSAETSIAHTIQWREQYMPWRVSAAMRTENPNGWVYHRGFSPPAAYDAIGRHALVFLRPGQHTVVDMGTYFRCILHAIDGAVADSLHDSHGHLGRFNILIDAAGFEWKKGT
jgi:hypothetical protein